MAPGSQLEEWVIDARARTLDLVRDLSDEQFRVPLIRTINPFLWEIGHAAYFQEYWVLRHAAGQAPMRSDADALYDSAKVAYSARPSPSRTKRPHRNASALVLRRDAGPSTPENTQRARSPTETG